MLCIRSVIEIVGNKFIFILPSGVSPDPTSPEKTLKQLEPVRHRSLQRSESAQLLRQIDREGEIEKLILAAFGDHGKRSTRDIISFATRGSPYDEVEALGDRKSGPFYHGSVFLLMYSILSLPI